MITPKFDVTQDDDFVIVRLVVPYAKLEEMDFYLVGTEFKFVMQPYFLRLTLPSDIVEDGREKAVHQRETSTLEVFLPKLRPGEVFPDLDIPTRLLPLQSDRAQLIEVLQSEESADAVPPAVLEPDHPLMQGIGFDGSHEARSRAQFDEAVVPRNIDRTQEDLMLERMTAEHSKFDPVYYMCD
jgi:hypothetical protein